MYVHLKQKRHIGDHNQLANQMVNWLTFQPNLLAEPSGKLVNFST